MIVKTILIFLLFVTPVMGMNLHSAMMMVTKNQVEACTTSNDSDQTAGAFYSAVDGSAGATWGCVKWVLASNITLTEHISRFDRGASDTVQITVCLLPHNAGTDLPDGTTCVTGTSVVKEYEDLASGTQNHVFTLASPVNVDAGTYWFCNYESAGDGRLRSSFNSDGIRSCYGTSSCDTASANAVNNNGYIYGCVR